MHVPHLTLYADKPPPDGQVHSYRAHQGISLPYAVDVEISTADASFSVDGCLQHRALLEAHDAQGGVSHFDGVLRRNAPEPVSRRGGGATAVALFHEARRNPARGVHAAAVDPIEETEAGDAEPVIDERCGLQAAADDDLSIVGSGA